MILKFVICSLVFCVTFLYTVNASEPVIDRSRLQTSIWLGMKYLCNAVNAKGRFAYCQHTDPNVKYPPGQYNIVRHAGTVYAMVEGLKYDPPAMYKTRLAAKYLVNHYLKELPAYPGCQAIISKPEDLEGNKQPEAKLGASALALCALTPLCKSQHGIVTLEQLRGLGKFLLKMQKPNGSSYSTLCMATDLLKGKNSLYYPGESALGLLKLNAIDPNEKWVTGAKKFLLFLAKRDKYAKDIPMDQWTIIATEELFRTAGDKLTDEERKLLSIHALQIANSYVFAQNLKSDDPKIFGSFVHAMTCPTATRLEGLVALRKFITNANAQKRLDHRIRYGLIYLMNAQILNGPLKGGFSRSTAPLPIEMNSPGYEQRMGEIRIDYVQHSISAMMNYMPYLQASKIKNKGL